MLDKRKFYINGEWVSPSKNSDFNVINPATGEPIGAVAHARTADLDLALEAAKSGFEVWKKTSPFSRYKMIKVKNSVIKLVENAKKQIINLEVDDAIKIHSIKTSLFIDVRDIREILDLIDAKITSHLSDPKSLGRVKRLENADDTYIKINN